MSTSERVRALKGVYMGKAGVVTETTRLVTWIAFDDGTTGGVSNQHIGRGALAIDYKVGDELRRSYWIGSSSGHQQTIPPSGRGLVIGVYDAPCPFEGLPTFVVWWLDHGKFTTETPRSVRLVKEDTMARKTLRPPATYEVVAACPPPSGVVAALVASSPVSPGRRHTAVVAMGRGENPLKAMQALLDHLGTVQAEQRALIASEIEKLR